MRESTDTEIRILTRLHNALPKMTDLQKGRILGTVETLEELSSEKETENIGSDTPDENSVECVVDN